MQKEKQNNQFEQIIQSEISDMTLDNLVGAEDASEKVSEIVGESAGETIPTGKKTKKKSTGFSAISKAISNLISPPKKVINIKLPSFKIQRNETKKAIVKQTRKLIGEATKLQNSKNFSADKLENIILEIRHLQGVLSKMFSYTAEKIENLYQKFVLKKN